jgi:hypothetical protein
MTFFPATIVGALRLPVGPSILSIISSDTSPLITKEATFLPFAIVMLSAEAAKLIASTRLSFRDAGMISFGTKLLASRNLDALTQLVQPLRK